MPEQRGRENRAYSEDVVRGLRALPRMGLSIPAFHIRTAFRTRVVLIDHGPRFRPLDCLTVPRRLLKSGQTAPSTPDALSKNRLASGWGHVPFFNNLLVKASALWLFCPGEGSWPECIAEQQVIHHRSHKFASDQSEAGSCCFQKSKGVWLQFARSRAASCSQSSRTTLRAIAQWSAVKPMSGYYGTPNPRTCP